MAVELAWSTFTDTGSDDWTVEMGGGLASGQLLVLMCYSSSGTIPTTPSGWDFVASAYTFTTVHRVTIFKRIADGTEGTITLINTVDSWILTAWTGYDISDGIPLAIESPAAQSLKTHVCPTVTMPSAGQVIRGLGVYSSSWTRPSGTTLIADSYGGWSIRQTHASYEAKSAGDTGTGSWTSSRVDDGTAFTIGIPGLPDPPPAPTVTPLTTTSTTPTLTGTFTASETDELQLTVDSVTYGDDDFEKDGNNWSLTLTTPLEPGTYSVTLTAINDGGETDDETDNELTIEEPEPPSGGEHVNIPFPVSLATRRIHHIHHYYSSRRNHR